jgi:subtilisin family serine protease
MRSIFLRLFTLIVAFTLLFSPASAMIEASNGPVATNSSFPSIKNTNSSNPEVDPDLLSQLAADETSSYLIYLHEKADLSEAHKLDWEARGWYVVTALQETAERSQKNVRAYLDSQGAKYQTFWIDNVIIVEQSNLATFNGLLGFGEIESLRAEVENFLIEPIPEDALDNQILAAEPNLVQIKATDVWASGNRGQGAVIANIDSGVRYTHEALVNQYRGNLGGGVFDHNYNWLDPDGGTTVPTDTNGHGTHVMGTMVGYDGGANEIGVAPEADWIACRGCLTSSCPSTALLACAQWITAPYPIGDPGSPNPDMRPFAVNNSWGNCQQTYNNWYQGAVDSWHAAGIYPIFANGNSGNCGYSSPPGLNTVGNPARYGNVTGVGSSGTSNGEYAPHSNWGPTDNPDMVNPQTGWEDLKPQVIAPGVNIRSSVISSDSAYASSGWTGTSMSAPHVTGLIALMWTAAPVLIGDYATTETLIEETATPIYYDDLGTGPRWPNYASGWGEINAYEAVLEAIAMSEAGTLEGTVTNNATGQPITGAKVEMESLDFTFIATTDADGFYSRMIPQDTYTVTVSAYGYLPFSVTGVVIQEDETTVLDVALQPAPTFTVSGLVSDATTGWPLYASIAVDGVPGSPFWTDPTTGFYSITLPEGVAYDLTVSAFVDGYLPEMFFVGPITSDMTVNVELDVNTATCIAPGYQPGAASGDYYDFEDDDGGFEGTIDWEWGTNYNWTGAGCDGTTNYPPPDAFSGVGMWATSLNGCYSNSGTFHILSFTADLTGQSSSILQWWDWYDVFETFDYGEVYANNTLVYDRATSYIPPTEWEQHEVDLTPFVGGVVEIEFRMFATTVVNRAGWYIDDVLVGEPACTPQAGGLVVGNVYDGNTAASLVGATIENESGGFTTAAATPLDPNVEDGFFTLFSPTGAQLHSAAMPGGYGLDEKTVNVINGGVVNQDFYLPAGWMAANPESVEVTLPVGGSFTRPLTLANDGELPAEFWLTTVVTEEHFEDDFPPEGWTVIDNGGNCVWQRNDSLTRPNYAGGEGFSAAADSDRCGSGTTMNTELWTPVFNLSEAASATLDFVASYRHLSTSSFKVHISTDGGDNWDTLLTWTASVDPTGPGQPVSLDLTPYVGSDETIISFHYTAPGWHWWVQVDQIKITSDAGAWLSFDPGNETIPAGEQLEVDLLLDAATITEIGTYTAVLLVEDDTPYSSFEIPVQMIVVEEADYGVHLDPAEANQAGEAGETIEYLLTLTNTGNVTDFVNLTVTGNQWGVQLSETLFLLQPGESVGLSVHVEIPPDAPGGASDTVIIIAISGWDISVTSTSVLTTSIPLNFIYMPLVSRN